VSSQLSFVRSTFLEAKSFVVQTIREAKSFVVQTICFVSLMAGVAPVLIEFWGFEKILRSSWGDPALESSL
jgi:hypothetical protein